MHCESGMSLPETVAWRRDIATRRLSVVAAVLVALLGAMMPAAWAQCPGRWLPDNGLPGLNGNVAAIVSWDPDGPGPLPPVIVVGGSFTIAGNTLANGIAAWDQATGQWSALGTGMSGGPSPNGTRVNALEVLPSGDLVAGGSFTTAGGVSVNSIARWNGTAWSTFGTGMSGGIQAYSTFVSALAVLPNGDLVAGGSFSSAGGVTASGIARWNGAGWSAFGTGINGGYVAAVVQLPNGDLVALQPRRRHRHRRRHRCFLRLSLGPLLPDLRVGRL